MVLASGNLFRTWAGCVLIVRLRREQALIKISVGTSEGCAHVNAHVVGDGHDATNLLNVTFDLII